jgi:hypothetical protein
MRHPLKQKTPEQVRGTINASTITRFIVTEIVTVWRLSCRVLVVVLFCNQRARISTIVA